MVIPQYFDIAKSMDKSNKYKIPINEQITVMGWSFNEYSVQKYSGVTSLNK